MRRRFSRLAQLLTIALVAGATLTYAGTAPADTAATHSAADFLYVKTLDQAVCQDIYAGGFLASYYTRGECTRVDFSVTNTNATSSVKVNFIGPDGGAPFRTQTASRLSSGLWRVVFRSDASWPAGKITLEVVANGIAAGEGTVFVNALGADVKVAAGSYTPGAQIPLQGQVQELTDIAGGTEKTGVPATFFLRARTPTGELRGPWGPYQANADGSFPADLALPAAATQGISAGPETNFEADIGIDVVNASHTDAVSGAWASKVAGSGSVTIVTPPQTLLLEAKFVSSLGWVKPGEAYPFRVLVKNFTGETKTGAVGTITAPDGVTFLGAKPLGGAGTATVDPTSISWRIPSIATGTAATLVVEARADTLGADPEIVWKDLSTKATLTYDGYAGAEIASTTRGPKVIPPTGGFETARYGDKPFPIIPVDFRDRKHKPHRTGRKLAQVVNDPNYAGSTYNLYQEMSFGQLHPFGSVPSANIASAGFDYTHGFDFTERDVTKPTCRGATLASAKPAWGTPLYPERIRDGWYQLPGDTEYYGGDFPVFTATTVAIDSACGDAGKLVYDAVQIADPEIDYNQFDSDKDGLVDFTMVVFVGCGGNLGSQATVGTFCEDHDEPYDNPWPHSSSLETGYQDEATGLSGYISDDQLTDLEG
ncbi:MAG: hypothetical protein M3310_07570, partial [Actinomycetota bacterium]|nr:hypothetical protein [Actinomycetota bacterium]